MLDPLYFASNALSGVRPKTGVYSARCAAQTALVNKMIDIPPVWLALALTLAWGQSRVFPLGPEPGAFVAGWGWGAILLGVLLILAAALAFLRNKTTIVPHRVPSRVIQTGIFAYTRNPIYLGDLFILVGAILVLGAWPSLVLVPAFVWWITAHFIRPEEDRMRVAFGEEFIRYERKVRRWGGSF